ncbi:Zinc/iron permease [Neofusicoccum parvum]|uniref:Zinc/iron permease n=1 Tax=Neofusicoccum parvum TaxID=310453 RepID=A0ACB5SMJ6_9PEZI|nr:Zinc/iron permease [Neofusicoccum parvum]GME62504.1 Zinc/iron permease [Neofusicoccum parvum]
MDLTKRATCETGRGSEDQYNTPLHVGALFIILFVSSSACAFPMLVIKFPGLRIPASFLFGIRHFGTGVLLATAFVHLLPTAFISLGDDCLSDFWTTDYPAMPGAIVLAAIFFITMVEMVFSPAQHMHGGEQQVIDHVCTLPQGHELEHTSSILSQETQNMPPAAAREDLSLRNLGPLSGRSNSVGRRLTDMGEQTRRADQGGVELARQQSVPEQMTPSQPFVKGVAPLTPEQEHKKALLQCMLLEMGILFHSVFIGMALSVSIGREFIILLIAIIFHQTFEGLALGSRIATLNWQTNAVQPWIMSLAYGCTTPVGQAIGLGLHTLYSPDSEVGLLVVGIMNAISSGLLVYASLVELMSEDFLSDESWRILRGKRRAYACILVFCGAIGMSLVGAWA